MNFYFKQIDPNLSFDNSLQGEDLFIMRMIAQLVSLKPHFNKNLTQAWTTY